MFQIRSWPLPPRVTVSPPSPPLTPPPHPYHPPPPGKLPHSPLSSLQPRHVYIVLLSWLPCQPPTNYLAATIVWPFLNKTYDIEIFDCLFNEDLLSGADIRTNQLTLSTPVDRFQCNLLQTSLTQTSAPIRASEHYHTSIPIDGYPRKGGFWINHESQHNFQLSISALTDLVFIFNK